LKPPHSDLHGADLAAPRPPTEPQPAASDRDRMGELRQRMVKMGPDRQLRLMVDIERGLLSGEDIPNANAILDLLRTEIGRFGVRPYRIGNPARWFFAPLEPYLVSPPRNKHIGYIARASLGPIWRLISRDLMPIESSGYSDLSRQALLANDIDAAVQLARRFQNLAITFLRPALATPEARENTRLRLAKNEASDSALEDLVALFTVFNARDDLDKICARLPRKITNFSGQGLDGVKSLLDRLIPDGSLVYGLIQVMRRLASPAQLVRLAVKDAESSGQTTFTASPYAMAVTLVIPHIEGMASTLQNNQDKNKTGDADELRRTIRDALKLMETELNVENSPSWKRILTLTKDQYLSMSVAQENAHIALA
jgi:hypothetical protein